MSIAVLARYASLSESMIRKLVQDSLDPLPSFLVGRSRRFSRQQVDIWMNRRRMAEPLAIDDVLEQIRRGR